MLSYSAYLMRAVVLAVFLLSAYSFSGNYLPLSLTISLALIAFAVFIAAETILSRMPSLVILCTLVGLFVGSLTGYIAVLPFRYILAEPSFGILSFFVIALFGYALASVAARRCPNEGVAGLKGLFLNEKTQDNTLLLDTNVLIDGRIADIASAGFITGRFVLPQFVLQELQYIADSPDSVRRVRGRRGMDTVKRMQKMTSAELQILSVDLPNLKEVDAKLVALAIRLNARIITNDYNLQKIAQLQGIASLNINELANMMKPLVLPGDIMNLFVVKEGRESDQGVAYTEEGAMVVIENGKRLIGRTIEAEVTSVLQTSGGRMIFAKARDAI